MVFSQTMYVLLILEFQFIYLEAKFPRCLFISFYTYALGSNDLHTQEQPKHCLALRLSLLIAILGMQEQEKIL